MRLTKKQRAILKVLVKGNEDGSFCDLDQLLERVEYETTKESMHFSIRALVKRNLVVKKPLEERRGRNRLVIAPTPLGYRVTNAGVGLDSEVTADLLKSLI